jgi:DNA relaxase NicK
MKHVVSKKRLKAGEQLQVVMHYEYFTMQNLIERYGTTPEEIFKLKIESEETYIDLYFNYGYAISSIKTAFIDDPDICTQYRCRVTLDKITEI